jgi:hypothetical protein
VNVLNKVPLSAQLKMKQQHLPEVYYVLTAAAAAAALNVFTDKHHVSTAVWLNVRQASRISAASATPWKCQIAIGASRSPKRRQTVLPDRPRHPKPTERQRGAPKVLPLYGYSSMLGESPPLFVHLKNQLKINNLCKRAGPDFLIPVVKPKVVSQNPYAFALDENGASVVIRL